ncbi:unnamed protein product [Effrenium voratum]|nr:unnamed protein product [Effrenium voratum]
MAAVPVMAAWLAACEGESEQGPVGCHGLDEFSWSGAFWSPRPLGVPDGQMLLAPTLPSRYTVSSAHLRPQSGGGQDPAQHCGELDHGCAKELQILFGLIRILMGF